MKIYTDIDYVLHDYSVIFLEVALEYFKTRKIPEPLRYPNPHPPSLKPIIEAFDMSEELVSHLIEISNETGGHVPTPCYDSIVNWIRLKGYNGADTVAITARATRNNAEKIISKCMSRIYSNAPVIPVITVDTPYKYLAIEDNSIYFEDHPDAIEGVLRHRENVTIVVPKWPWNLDIPKHKNIIHCEPDKFDLAIDQLEERLHQYV